MAEVHWSGCLLPKDPEGVRDGYLQLRCVMDNDVCVLRDQQSPVSIRRTISLGKALLDRFSLFGGFSFLEESITVYRSLILRSAVEPSQLSAILDGLGEGLCERFVLFSAADDISEALRLHEQSLQLCAENALDNSRSMVGIAWVLFVRAMRGFGAHDRADGIRAGELLRKALRLPLLNDANKLHVIIKLCHVLGRSVDDFDEAEVQKLVLHASDLAPPGHPDYPHLLVHVALVLSDLCYATTVEHRKTIMEVLRYGQDLTLAIAHPWNITTSRRLATALINECETSGDTTSMDEALALARTIWKDCSPLSVFFRPTSTHLIYVLAVAYDVTGELHFLDEEVTVGQKALAAEPSGAAPFKPLLHNLCDSLQRRYQLVGHQEDLDSALSLSAKCLVDCFPITSVTARYVRAASALNLLKYQRFGLLSDLDEAIRWYRQYIPSLGDYSLRQNIRMVETAVQVLCLRYDVKRDSMDLDEAVDLVKCSLPGAANSPSRSTLLHCLCRPLCMLAQLRGDILLAELAVTAEEEALASCPPQNPYHIHYLAGLAQNYATLWALSGNTESMHKASAYFAQAVGIVHASPHIRLEYAITWTACATEMEPEMLSEAYRQAVSLLPRVTHFAGNWKSRLLALQKAPGLARDAAMHALTYGHVDEALELLEQGRAVFWNQALGTGRSMDGLPSHLVKRLTAVSRNLEMSEPDEHKLSRTMQLSDELEALLVEARKAPGYDHFLAAEPVENLRAAAKSGPVVVLVANTQRAAAIIIRSPAHSPMYLPLEGITLVTLGGWASSLRAAGNTRNAELGGGLDSGGLRLMLRKKLVPNLNQELYTDVLGQLWEHIGRPVIDALELKRGTLQLRPRIFWCCTGHFSSLPVHAAGCYKGATPECMSDFAISSYTPTIAALLKATRQVPRQPLHVEERSVLIVAEANAPGHLPLPNTLEETALLRGLLPSATIADTSHGQTSMRSVLDALPMASVLHLASHGRQDPKAPLDSGFVLHDGVLTLSMLMEARTHNANFAFLSACQSAMGDDKLPDEAIHLAAAMMFIGFRSVVATLWSMNDADGPTVAACVYRELLDSKCETFDYDAIPRALDAVVRELREDGVHPSRWATWIHMGI